MPANGKWQMGFTSAFKVLIMPGIYGLAVEAHFKGHSRNISLKISYSSAVVACQ
jgi:hypothetical protein